jgi:cell division protein FtsQ
MTVSPPPSLSFDDEPPVTRRASRSKAAADVAGVTTSGDGASGNASGWRQRPRWQRIALTIAAACSAVTLVASPWWGPRVLAQLDFFHVRTVEFEGVRFAKTAELLRRLRVDTAQSVWQPLDSLTARLETHPMILRVDVTRDLPGTLRVLVVERAPVALVQAKGGLRPADATGAVLPIDPAVVPLDMPIASSADSALLAALDGLRVEAPALFARVAQASRISSSELRFVLTGGSVGAAGPAMVPSLVVRTAPDVTVARFKDILPVEADLARNHLRAVELDLRFRHQVIARQP